MIGAHRVIAVEEHFVTADFVDTAHRLPVASADRLEVELTRTVERSEPTRTALFDLERRVRQMDDTGQDVAVLSLNPPGVQPYEAPAATRLARRVNDVLAAIVRGSGARFGGLGTVAPQDPHAAAEEIKRVMGPLGLHGIMINSHTRGSYLDDPSFAPILEAAQATRAAIYLHPRVPAAQSGYLDYGLSGAIWGYQAEASLHAMRLILSGTLDRYPALTIVLGHLGEGIPYWLRRIDNRHAFARQMAGAATPMPALELTPSEYFHRNFVVTTSGVDDLDVLDLALSAVGEDNVLFAVDAPYEDPAMATDFLRRAPIGEQQRAKISHRNAERVFSLR